MRLIDADELIPSLKMGEVNADTAYGDGRNGGIYFAIWRIGQMPTIDAVPVVRCKDCIHQQKVFHEDKRIKEGGYYICGCELADGYSVVCLDGDFCSRGKRRSDEADRR